MPRYLVLLSLFCAVVTGLGLVGASAYLYLIATLVVISVLVWASLSIDLNFFLKAICRSEKKNSIALTFDDGPLEGKTDKILDILKEQNVKASFFFIGNRLEKNPQLAKRAYEEGHVIGGHSYWHQWSFGFQSSGKVSEEISQTADRLKSIIGLNPRFFRPPFGVTNPSIAAAVEKSKVVTIGWSLRSLDTVIKEKETLMNRLLKVKPGDIVLLHDYCDNTIDLLPEFIQMAKKRGIAFETLEIFLSERAYE